MRRTAFIGLPPVVEVIQAVGFLDRKASLAAPGFHTKSWRSSSEQPSSPAGAACKTRMPRETSMAAPVRCSAWFGVPFHIPAGNYFCQKPWSMPPWM